ncbi:TlpA family protein disulfide reductase [Aquimarina rhabdastrellae]
MITTIKVHDLDQNEVDLINLYNNKPLVLIFYNNECLGCTGRAIPLAYEYQQEFKDIQVLGIHSNFRNNDISRTDIESIFTKKETPFPIYIDKHHRVYDDFNCEGTPQWVLIKKDGTVYRSIFGSQSGAQNRLLYAIQGLIEEDNL